MDPIYDYAYKQAAEELFSNINDKQRAAMIAYEALVRVGLENYFDVGFESNNGKETVVFIHTDSGTICKTINAAKAYMKSSGRRAREKNVQSDPVSIKVNKDRSFTKVNDDTVRKIY